jgi:hypothetical protein
MLAAYLTTGTFVEFVAVTTYNALAQMVADEAAKEILTQMSRQEGRHMRFYRKGAIAVMEDSPSAQAFVREIVRRYWRPPGVDLYGYSEWVDVFAPLLRDPATLKRYLRMDDLCNEIPGLRGLRLMGPFLDRCKTTLANAPQLEAIDTCIRVTA